MIMYEAEPIRDSHGNQWSKTELKCWRSANQLLQVHYVIWKNSSTLDRRWFVPGSHRSRLFHPVIWQCLLRVLSQGRATVHLQCNINPVVLYEKSMQSARRTIIIERAWHKRNEKCLEWRTISNESYQLKAREQCLHFHSKARHCVDVSNRSRLTWKQKLVD